VWCVLLVGGRGSQLLVEALKHVRGGYLCRMQVRPIFRFCFMFCILFGFTSAVSCAGVCDAMGVVRTACWWPWEPAAGGGAHTSVRLLHVTTIKRDAEIAAVLLSL
jgi:hypothetical protein